MTLGEYYELLKAAYAKVDWDDLKSVEAYNDYRYDLRKELKNQED